MPRADVASPCTGICELNARAVCTGCGRTSEEIAAWMLMSAADKRAVRQAANARLKHISEPNRT